MSDAIIDRIYEAAFVPDMWPQLLQMMGRSAGSVSSAVLLYNETTPVRFKATNHAHDVLSQLMDDEEWKADSRLISHYYANPLSGFVRAEDYFTSQIIDADASYQGLKERGLEPGVGTIMPMLSGELVVFVMHRLMSDGPFDDRAIEQFNQLHPHLSRAAFIAARLGLERAQATVSALDAIGLPAAVLSGSGRMLAANGLLEELEEPLLHRAYDKLALSQADTNALFQTAIAQSGNSNSGIVQSIPIAATEASPALVIHIIPLRRAAHDIFNGADILVAFTKVSASRIVPAPSVLMGLFDLTPAEVRLASALAEGRTLKLAAQKCGIAFSTARFYLEKIFAKTGTNQQSQLIALLTSAQPMRGH